MEFFYRLTPPVQALIATVITWLITALGATPVFFFKHSGKKLLCAVMGLAAGVMLAASYFSLLAPAIDSAQEQSIPPWLALTLGFFGGGAILYLGDKKMKSRLDNRASDPSRRSALLILSMTLHNIPEGMAIGVAFGYGGDVTAACLLALGIGLQNFPEGTAVALPLRAQGYSRKKSFLISQLSGAVEPISGVLGALLVMQIRPLMPFLLSFAAGAMIYVVLAELIPESQNQDDASAAVLFTLIGFSVMMLLDVALG